MPSVRESSFLVEIKIIKIIAEKKKKRTENKKFEKEIISIGEIKVANPKARQELTTIVPKEFPKENSSCFLIAAFKPKASSGKVVPNEIKIKPIRIGGIFKSVAKI